MHKPGYLNIPKAPNPLSGDKLQGHASKTQVGGENFGSTMASMLNKANTTMGAAEDLSIRAVTTGDVDIHEVMIALGKSEVTFKLITSVTQKVIGAADKLTSMQI